MVILKFISVVLLTICSLLYFNNIIVDIGSAIASSRTLSPTAADDADRSLLYAKYRIVLSIIIGISLGIIICI